jgi:hypothetical protein
VFSDSNQRQKLDRDRFFNIIIFSKRVGNGNVEIKFLSFKSLLLLSKGKSG